MEAYIHEQYFVPSFIGPFESVTAAEQHLITIEKIIDEIEDADVLGIRRSHQVKIITQEGFDNMEIAEGTTKTVYTPSEDVTYHNNIAE